ncbi:MAG TPA: hypothetical protein PK771_03340 [Spirochaetota bacterium]|nr:hypothetical protein [Spirochaetota bacterium]
MKGFINSNFGDNYINSVTSIENSDDLKNELEKILQDLVKENYLEISYNFSNNYNYLLNIFKNGYFISDDSFNALLTYHYSQKHQKKLQVYNYSLNEKDINKLNLSEKFDFIFSSYGITYENLFNDLNNILGLLKIGGIMFLEMPSYWFFRDHLNEDEKSILNYSKTSDKKWVFTEDINPIIEENSCEIILSKKINNKKIMSRVELSYLSSLNKLHKASLENNIAVLEVANVREDNLEINSVILVIKKKSKTITKNNLFNI